MRTLWAYRAIESCPFHEQIGRPTTHSFGCAETNRGDIKAAKEQPSWNLRGVTTNLAAPEFEGKKVASSSAYTSATGLSTSVMSSF